MLTRNLKIQSSKQTMDISKSNITCFYLDVNQKLKDTDFQANHIFQVQFFRYGMRRSKSGIIFGLGLNVELFIRKEFLIFNGKLS